MDDKQLTTLHVHNNLADTVLAMAEVKNSLNKATLDYASKVKEYEIEITKLKETITIHRDKMHIYSDKFDNISKDIEYETRLLKRLNETFTKKADIVEEFKVEFEDKLDKKEYDKLRQRKLKDIVLLTDEIEEVEQTLLERELDRLNILSDLEPYQRTLDELNRQLLNLQLEKEYYESIQVHNISNINLVSAKIDDIVDLDVT